MTDQFDDSYSPTSKDTLTPLNIKKKPKNQTAVAIRDAEKEEDLPQITAAGRGKIAEQILQLAFENDIKVREDSALAEMLVSFELDSPIPSEAFMAVAEILSYVYRANGQANPFDTTFQDAMDKEDSEIKDNQKK
jgi:flagellar biosynthesis protein